MKHTLSRGREAFLEYYSHLFPKLDLESYLSRKNPAVILVSPFHEAEIQKQFTTRHLPWQPLDWFPHTILWPRGVPYGTPLPGFKQGQLYSLNPASLLPIITLDPHPNESILDACAAPGGKTLAILCLTYPRMPVLIANEVSLPRFKRLRTVLKLFGFPDTPTTHHSVQALPHHLTGLFDKILLDAPCSSEKHVFNSKSHLKLWSPNRIATLAHRQKLLLKTLAPLIVPGGRLVYSTCAINPRENEEGSPMPQIFLSNPCLTPSLPPTPCSSPPYLAKTNPQILSTPACFSVFAHSLIVAPVVHTSSTSKMFCGIGNFDFEN